MTNDLLSKNRRLETHFQWVLKNKTRAVKAMLRRPELAPVDRHDSREVDRHRHQHGGGADLPAELANTRDPRRALEPSTLVALLRGAPCTEPAHALSGAGATPAPAVFGDRYDQGNG